MLLFRRAAWVSACSLGFGVQLGVRCITCGSLQTCGSLHNLWFAAHLRFAAQLGVRCSPSTKATAFYVELVVRCTFVVRYTTWVSLQICGSLHSLGFAANLRFGVQLGVQCAAGVSACSLWFSARLVRRNDAQAVH